MLIIKQQNVDILQYYRPYRYSFK